MPPKIGKKVGIHFYENILSEMNLPLPSSSEDEVSTSAMPSGGKIVTLRFRTGLPGDDTINDDLRGCAVLFSYTPITTGGFLSEGFFCRSGGGGSIGQASSASSEKIFSMSNYA